jgi:GntR family carbon starvation induced transcriptional regulator
MARMSGRTRAGDVYTALRDEILGGVLVPGQRLFINELAATHGVSLGVVREAVTRLASEQLLEATPQQGFRVRRLSLEDLQDLAWLRTRVEAIAVREAIARGDLAWEADLVAAHHRLKATPMWHPDGEPNREFMTVHSAFHAALTAGSRRPRLLHVRQQLFDAAELYRYWAGAVGGLSEQVVAADHEAILEATLARDADRAAQLLTEHLDRTARHLAERADQFHDPDDER